MRLLPSLLPAAAMLAVIMAGASCSGPPGRAAKKPNARCVVFLLDASESVPAEQQALALEYVNAAVLRHRGEDDRVGVLVFGRTPHWEIPLAARAVELARRIESQLDPGATDLAAAIRLAAASFPADCGKRMVILSDGNQTQSDALAEAQAAAAAGIGIDVVPIRYSFPREVAVERLSVAGDVRLGAPFELKAALSNSADPNLRDPGESRGRLLLRVSSRDASGMETTTVASEEKVALAPGRKVFTLPQRIDVPGYYTYRIEFLPDGPRDDGHWANNRALAMVEAPGKRQVLLLEHADQRGQYDLLATALRQQGIEVVVQPSNVALTGLAEFYPYDAIILAGVPREGFAGDQPKALVACTQHLGCGLIMLGGRGALGPGGWINSELAAIMPLDFDRGKSADRPGGALVVVFDGSLARRPGQWHRAFAREALRTLGDNDHCGVLYHDQGPKWAWEDAGLVRVGEARAAMLGRMETFSPDEAPDFDPLLKAAARALEGVKSPLKHIVVLSDGSPAAAAAATISGLAQARITVTTIAVGGRGPAGSVVLANMAAATGGKYYQVNNLAALPRIAQAEARRACQGLVWETRDGVRPEIKTRHEMLNGINEPLPAIHGLNLTAARQEPRAEVLLEARVTGGDVNVPLLAVWQSGRGKAAVFASDAAARWMPDWRGQEVYGRLFGKLVRWAMRPAPDPQRGLLQTDVQQGELRVRVRNLDPAAQVPTQALVVRPNLGVVPIELVRTGPGEFAATCRTDDGGLYCVSIAPGPPLTRFEFLPSPELQHCKSNDALLKALAALQPEGGAPGEFIEAEPGDLKELLKVNPFRDLASAAPAN